MDLGRGGRRNRQRVGKISSAGGSCFLAKDPKGGEEIIEESAGGDGDGVEGGGFNWAIGF